MTEIERRLKKAEQSGKIKTSTQTERSAASSYSETSDAARRWRIFEEQNRKYSAPEANRRAALQRKTESWMDLTTEAEPEARAAIDRYKATEDAKYYAAMNQRGATIGNDAMQERGFAGYKGAYDLWKSAFDRETDAAADRTRREREMTENPAKAPTVSDIVSRYSGKTKTLADLGNNVRGAIDAYKRQSDAAKAAPTPEEAMQQAEESVQYWQNVAREAARYGDVYRQATARKHLADSVENYSRATKGYFDNLKTTDPGTYYALTMTPEEIDHELELLNNGAYLDSKITNSLTNDERIMGEYWHRTPQEQRQYEHNLERARFAGETDDERNAYISSEKEAYLDARNRMLNDASVEGSVGSNQEPYNRREEITQANEARKSVLENARLTQKVIQADREGITNDPQIIASGKQKFEKDQQEIWNNSTVQPGWTPGSSAQTSLDLYQHNYSSAYENGYVLDSMTRLTDEQRNKVYALYDRDPQTALKLAQTYAKALDDKVYQEIFDWVAKDSGWQFGRRAVGNLAGAVMNLASGLDPFGYGGQSAGKVGDALIGGAAQSATRNGWFGIEELGGDRSPISSSVPFVGRGRAGEASQLVSSMEQSALTTLPALVAGRYDAAAASWLETAGLLLQSSSAARSDYRESIEAGLDDTTAKIHAVAAGIAEYMFEKVSFDKLLAQNTSRMTFKKAMKDVLVQAGIEGSEELHTTLANTIMDEIISGDGKSKIDRRIAELVQGGMSMREAKGVAEKEWLTGIVNDFIGGAASGGIMTGAHYAVGATVNTAENKIAGETRKEKTKAGAAISRSEGSVEAIQAYAKDNGIEIKAVETAEQNAGESAEQGHQDGSKQNSYSNRDYRSISDTNSKVVQSIRSEVRGKTVQEQQTIRDNLVEKYGDGIAPVVNQAISVETAARVRQEYGSVDSIQAARNQAVSEIKDESLRQAVSDGYDSAAYALAANQGGEAGMNTMSRYIQQRRNTGSGSEMSMNATVTAQDGSTKTIAITGMSEDGKRVSLADGSEVAVKDLQADEDTTSAIQQLADLGLGVDATKVLEAYQQSGVSGTDGYRWLMDYATAYNQGRTRQISLEQAAQRSSLDERTVMDAYTLGQQAANRETQAGLEKLKNLPKRKGASGRTANIDTTEIKGKTMSKSEMEQFELANQYAQALGVDMVWFSSREQGGKFVGKNGAYENGKIYMDIHAGRNFAADLTSGILATMGHELTHFQQQYAPEEYQALKSFLFEQIAKSSPNGEARLERLIWEKQRRSGNTLSRKAAEDEVVADACQKMLRDSKAVHDFASQQPEAANGVVRWLDKWFKKVRSIFGRGGNYSEEAQIMDSLEQDVKAAFGELWDKALKQAAKVHDEVGNIEKPATEKAQNSDREDQSLQGLVSELENQLDMAELNGLSQAEIRKLNNELIKARGQLDTYTANQRRQAKRTSFNEILRNLEDYERVDLESLAEQISDSAWNDYDELSDEELIDALRETINERLDDFAPGDADNPKYGLFVKKPKATGNIGVVRNSDRDTEYLELAKDPEKNKARLQEMVDEAVKEAMPESKVRDKNGKLLKMFHGTQDQFTVFDPQKIGTNAGMADGPGFYFSSSKGENSSSLADASLYGQNIISAYLDIQNPLTPKQKSINRKQFIKAITDLDWEANGTYRKSFWESIYDNAESDYYIYSEFNHRTIPQEYNYTPQSVIGLFENLGYDGVIFDIDNGNKTHAVVFNSNQIKSADPVTYDDAGNVIPLSERFNPENKDIRYSERDNAKPRSAQAQRDAGYKLSESKFYSLYSAHKLNMTGRGNVQEQIASIMADGFKGDGGFGNNVMPTNISYDVDENGKRIPRGLSAQKYAPKKGEYILLVPKEGVEVKGGRYNFTERVKPGYKPAFDYEIVKADYDGQPYYEMYERAYDKSQAGKADVTLDGAQFSERDYDTPSDMELLLNADESTAENKNQLGLLKEYKALGKRSKTLQDRLDALNKEKADREASGKKYKEGYLKIKNAEISKLESELAAVRDAMEKKILTPQLFKLLEAERNAAAKEIAAKKDESFRKYKERKNQAAIRNRIKNLHAEMSRDLLRPREGHFVPEKLIRPVVDLLDLVNTETNRAKSESAQARIDAINAAYDAIKKDERYSQFYDETVKDMLVELSGTMAGRSIYDLTTAELEDVYTVMKAMRTTIRNAIKADLIEKGKEIWEIGNEMRQELRAGRGAHALQLLEKYHMTMLSAKRAFNRFGGYQQSSAWNKVYRMLDDAQLKMLTLEMQGTRIFDRVLEGKENLEKAEKLTSYREDDLVDVGLKDETGKAVPIPRGMMLSLYMHLQNEENMRHLMYGGITLPDFKRYYKGRSEAWGQGTVSIPALGAMVAPLDELFSKGELSDAEYEEAYKEHKAEIDEIFDSIRKAIEEQLTDYDRQWIAASREFFDGFSRRELNRVTNEMYGFSKARVNNYFPIVTDSDFLKSEFESISKNISLENAGFMKERVRASNPIHLEDITKAVNRQISNVSRYAGLTQALKTFGNVYNVQDRGFTDSVKKAMAKTYGKNGQQYVENLITDMVGGRNTPGTIFDRVKGNYAQAVLAANLSVTIKQAASFPTAAATVGWGPLMKAMARGGKSNLPISRADSNLISIYSPLLWYRSKGAIDVEIGDIANGRDWTQKAKWLMGWIEKTDRATVGRLWYAAEYYVKDNYNLEKGTEEQIKNGESPFYRKVAEVFADIVEDTQPNYTILQRPDILRNPNKLVRAMVMFSTQRFQNGNILIDAIGEYRAMVRADKQNGTPQTKTARKAARQKLTRAISSQTVSAMVLSAMTLLAGAVMHRMNPWRDDDDELTFESIAEEYLNGFLSSLTGSFLAGSEVYEGLQAMLTGSKYYGNDVGGISTINELATSVIQFEQQAVKLIGDEDSTAKDWQNLAEKQLWKVGEYLSQMTGIPTANIKKIIEGGRNHIADIMNEEFFSFEAGVDRSTAVNARRYMKAIQAGDTEKAEAVMEEMRENYKEEKPGLSEKAITRKVRNALASYIKEQYTSKEISEDEAISYLVDYAGKKENDAFWQIREWEAKKAHKGEAEYTFSPYEHLHELIDNGKDLTGEITYLQEHGKTASAINSDIKKYIRQQFDGGELNEQEAMKMLQKYHKVKDDRTGKYRNDTEDEAWFILDEWKAGIESEDDEEFSYEKYRKLYSAMDNDDDASAAWEEMSEHGVSDDTLKKAVSAHLQKQFQAGDISEDVAIDRLQNYRGMDEDEAYWQVDKWKSSDAAYKAGEDFNESNYRDLYAAIDGNKDPATAMKELTSHGYKERDIYEAAKEYMVKRFEDAKMNESQLKNQLSRYAKVTKNDDVSEIVTKAKCYKETGYRLDNLNTAYLDGEISADKFKQIQAKYGGMSTEDVKKRVRWLDVKKANPDLEVTEAQCNTWYDGSSKSKENRRESAKAAGMSIENYIKAKAILADVKDANGNKTGEDEYIAALTKITWLTPRQKDALYYERYKGTTKYSHKTW